MKKTLIAIAAIAATSAFAQSTVTIDGLVDSGFVQAETKGKKVSGIDQNISDTSQINFRGRTDLGGGLVADFRAQTTWSAVSSAQNVGGLDATKATRPVADQVTSGSTFGNGEMYLGLRSNSFGYIQMGALNGMGLTHTLTSQPFGTAFGSGFNLATNNGLVGSSQRSNNAFAYTSPELMKGLTAKVLMRKQQLNSSNANVVSLPNSSLSYDQNAVLQLGLNYSNNGLTVAISRITEDGTNRNTAATVSAVPVVAGQKGTVNNIAVNYALDPSITLYAGYQSASSVNQSSVAQDENRFMNFGAKYVTGVHTFLGNYGRFNVSKLGGSTNLDGKASSSILGLGYEYALSRTVALTVRHESINDDSNRIATTATLAGDVNLGKTGVTRTGVGLRMSF